MVKNGDMVWGVPIRSSHHHISEKILNDMRMEGDTLADAALEAFFERYPQLQSCQADGFVTALKLETKVYNSLPGYEEEKKAQDPRISKFMASVLSVPEWLDYDMLIDGQATFLAYSTSSMMGLLYYSLIGGFSAPKIISVLDATGYLSRSGLDATYRRLNETFDMVLDCLEEDNALKPEARGFYSVLKVRLLHARVRYRILKAKKATKSSENLQGTDWDSSTNRIKVGWDVQENGVPINQEDMMGTLLSFSTNVLETIEKIGSPFLTRREKEAYLHLWRYIGYLIGVKEEINPCTSIERAQGAVESVVLHLLHPNERSKILANNVIRAVSYRAPTDFSPQLHAQLARGLLGVELSNALEIGGEEDLWVSLYAWWIFFSLRLIALFLPFVVHRKSFKGKRALDRVRSRLRYVVDASLGRGSAKSILTNSKNKGEGRKEAEKSPQCPFGFTASDSIPAPHPLPAAS